MFSKWKVLFLISNILSILTSWHFTIKKSFHFSPTYLLICLCQCEFIDFYSLSCPCYYLLSYSHFPGFGEAELPVDLARFCRHHLAVFPSLKSVGLETNSLHWWEQGLNSVVRFGAEHEAAGESWIPFPYFWVGTGLCCGFLWHPRPLTVALSTHWEGGSTWTLCRENVVEAGKMATGILRAKREVRITCNYILAVNRISATLPLTFYCPGGCLAAKYHSLSWRSGSSYMEPFLSVPIFSIHSSQQHTEQFQ